MYTYGLNLKGIFLKQEIWKESWIWSLLSLSCEVQGLLLSMGELLPKLILKEIAKCT